MVIIAHNETLTHGTIKEKIMNLSKKAKIIALSTLVAGGLSSCSNTQMGITALALAGTAVGYEAYNWMNNPDAETALGQPQATVFNSVQTTMENKGYQIVSTTKGAKESEINALSNGEKVNVVVQTIGNNESKVFIKDGRGKDQATILINQIIKNIK